MSKTLYELGTLLRFSAQSFAEAQQLTLDPKHKNKRLKRRKKSHISFRVKEFLTFLKLKKVVLNKPNYQKVLPVGKNLAK
jgi:hypothetical protein